MGGKSRRAQTRAMREQTAMTREQFEYQKAEHEKQKLVVAQQKQQYMDFEFTNPYADAQNFFAGMENPYEDMTIDMKAVDFQRQQMQQQQANILQSLRGSAGSSGVAGLAQALANQGALQAQKISADLAKQEVSNEQLAAKQAARLQELQAKGEAEVQQAESGQQATLLGMQFGALEGANTAYQQAVKNQMVASQTANQMQMEGLETLSKVDYSVFKPKQG